MLQESKPAAFASRSLTKNERGYPQIDKEMLAIVVSVTKFHHYIYRRKVLVDFDHKPLVGVTKKGIGEIGSARLQRMRIKLM